MNEIHEGDDAVPAPEAQPAVVNAARRRFARAGVAAPVVLGSLVSRPVLGADPAYHCTVSGQLSGNVSVRPGTTTVCSTIGSSAGFWLTAGTTWPSAVTRGTLPNAGCSFGSGSKGTVFNGFQGLASAFFFANSSGACLISTASSSSTASLYQVLASTQTGALYDLGRATVVSLLNAYSVGSSYPVKVATIVAMFNATYLGGTFQVNSTVSWSRAQVIAYLTSLYPAG